MKKNLWFVFVALAMVAIFTVAGCTPSTPTPSPTATPTAAPTVAPDTTPPDVVSTVVSKVYGANNYNFKITITFSEPIESGCIEDPGNWTVAVSNSKRQDTNKPSVSVYDVSLSSDAKKAIVLAKVTQTVVYSATYMINGAIEVVSGNKIFDGLICSTQDAENYAKLPTLPTGAVVIASSPDEPTVADTVSWSFKNCVIQDEFGNPVCNLEGKDCCEEPVCESCVEECELGGGICQ